MSKTMAEIPREKLKELVAKIGDSLLQDPDRCEGLLKDHCGAHRREISALVGASSRHPLTSSTGCNWSGWRAPHSAVVISWSSIHRIAKWITPLPKRCFARRSS